MLAIILSLSCLFLCSFVQGQSTLENRFLRQLGNSSFVRSQALVCDSSGNSYITGYYRDQLGPYQSKGSDDVFVAKYDSSGNQTWLLSLGASLEEQAYDLALSADGRRLYVAGMFRDTLAIGRDSLFGQGQTDMFVLELDSAARLQRAWSFGGAGYDYAYSIVLDRQGGFFLTGSFEQSIDFGNGQQVQSQGSADICALHINSQGLCTWAQAFGGPGYDAGQSLCLSARGRLYLCGYFANTAGFASQHLQSQGSSDAFVLQLDTAQGQLLWLETFGGTGVDNATALATDSLENLYLAGNFHGRLQSSSFSDKVAAGESDYYLAAWDSLKTPRWLLRDGGLHDERVARLQVAQNRFLYLAGSFEGLGQFGPDSVESRHNPLDAFVAKYNSDGEYKQFHQMGGWGNDLALGLAVRGELDVLVTGVFQLMAYFPDTLFAQGSSNVFLARFQDLDSSYTGSPPLALQAPSPSFAALRMFPNPNKAGQQLTIQGQEQGPCELRLHSLDGRLILHKSLEAGQESLLLPSELPAGLYILLLEQKKQGLIYQQLLRID